MVKQVKPGAKRPNPTLAAWWKQVRLLAEQARRAEALAVPQDENKDRSD